jgi:hypothetical protein
LAGPGRRPARIRATKAARLGETRVPEAKPESHVTQDSRWVRAGDAGIEPAISAV